MPDCKEFTGIQAVRNEYSLSYRMEEVYWPLYYAREVDAEGELEKYSTEAGPKRCLAEKFQEYVESRLQINEKPFDTGVLTWHNVDELSHNFQVVLGLTGHINAPWGATFGSFCERVSEAIQDWNEYAENRETEVVEWHSHHQNTQDPLDLASLDILL